MPMDHRLHNVDRVERNAVPDTTFAATAAQPIPGRWKALAVIAAGLSLIILDGTIVGVALPTMISALNPVSYTHLTLPTKRIV